MDAELADRRVDRRHFGGEIGGDLHLLARGENIELVGIEDQPPVRARADRLPEILRRVAAGAIDVDDVAVLDRAIADELCAERRRDRRAASRPRASRARRRRAALARGARAARRRPARNSCLSRCCELRLRNRIWLSREPSRTRTLKLRGEISSHSRP